MRKISSSGNPVIAPTLSNASGDPPCASMTRFAVSTTNRTLSVSVPSRSQRTARTVMPQLASEAPRVLPRRCCQSESASATTARDRDGGLDRQRRLFGEAAIAGLSATSHKRLELVVERIRVLETRVDDLESQVAHRIGLRETLEHHLADPLRSDLGGTALTDRRLEVVDQAVDRVGSELLRRRLPDRAPELASIEFLTSPVALHDLDAGRLRALAGRESLAARVAGATAADRVAVLAACACGATAGVGRSIGRCSTCRLYMG